MTIDPIFAVIEAHRQAYGRFDANVSDGFASDAAFGALERCCRRLVAADFTTLQGLIALLEYMSPLLEEPGAPAMPLEIGVADQQWETVFGTFCANLAKSLAALVTAQAMIMPEHVDHVAEAIGRRMTADEAKAAYIALPPEVQLTLSAFMRHSISRYRS